jgi:hypothetical protein
MGEGEAVADHPLTLALSREGRGDETPSPLTGEGRGEGGEKAGCEA